MPDFKHLRTRLLLAVVGLYNNGKYLEACRVERSWNTWLYNTLQKLEAQTDYGYTRASK